MLTDEGLAKLGNVLSIFQIQSIDISGSNELHPFMYLTWRASITSDDDDDDDDNDDDDDDVDENDDI